MNNVKRVAVVQGAGTTVVQDLLRRFAAQLEGGARLAGVIEDPAPETEGPCVGGDLRSLSDGRRFQLMQDLGPGSDACRLDAGGVVSAADAVQQGIAAGCDLVILNKFGKIEAERSGLAPAFASAIEAGLPILTSVSPRFADAWDQFAAPLYVILPPDMPALEAWWRGVRPGAVAPKETVA
jgi:hypothetical protein